MEALSPTMEEGRLVSWHKAEGDAGEERRRDRRGRDGQGRDGAGRARRWRASRKRCSLRARPRRSGHSSASLLSWRKTSRRSSRRRPLSLRGATASTAAPAAAAAPPPPPPLRRQPAAPPLRRLLLQRRPHRLRSPHRAPAQNGGRVRSSPLARRLASERGVELGAIAGSGPNGRIMKRDVEGAVATPAAGTRRRARAGAAARRPR